MMNKVSRRLLEQSRSRSQTYWSKDADLADTRECRTEKDASAVFESDLELTSDASAEAAAAGLDAREAGGRECQYRHSTGLLEL